ncbi:MAG: hypothetical protein KDA41_06730, partial [Planctomycetales bacterium]|nr:hypothetical protein [Planctomycetales bacterium]
MLRPEVLAARELLAGGREKLAAAHAEGAPGIQVSAQLGDLINDAISGLLAPAAKLLPDPSLDSQF